MAKRYSVEYNYVDACWMIVDMLNEKIVPGEKFIYSADANEKCGTLNDSWQKGLDKQRWYLYRLSKFIHSWKR